MSHSTLSIGIVGLPNVGKSTLFKTLTKKEVDIANYPFCTIDPNVGVVLVSDERVDKLAELTKSAKKIYTTIEFVDIAGLVKGANKGEGLGNKFLAHIRETDAIIYILRAFLNPDIINTQNTINPLQEKAILDVELILKDLETVSKRIESLEGDIRANKKEAIKESGVLKKAKDLLTEEKILIEQNFSEEEKSILNSYQLLTLKPRLYLLNGKDEEVSKETLGVFNKNSWPYLILDLAMEFETAGFSKEERVSLGFPPESELDILIKRSYELLNLITFLTTGPDETRAWTIKKGERAPQAGGVIHSDFEKNFIKAEVIHFNDLIKAGGYSKAREEGLIRTEGKEYVIQDGDVIEIKHG
ncbi:redox-regulated ATPase YchF [Patescibacteria group bacterium]|nr:redox-regulated ATPase YchF [Patescibacteria group bacterium]MBU4367646.1 redox-regulated ATPase YchF [Patescibacteria group bacterium]MBU4462126.1 redox-regulated ATPase YchF [Patescibacteria group bacterium]MCG2700445.1 redox-regulated ATPase YchF [Candidatus Parcubacteria bacterium]